MSANSDVDLDEIQEMVLWLFFNDKGDIQVSTELDRSVWPINVSEWITEDVISRTETNSVTIDCEKHVTETGVELREQNYTGGDYADVEQELVIKGTLNIRQDDNGIWHLAEDDWGSLLIQCDISTRNERSVTGESPPF